MEKEVERLVEITKKYSPKCFVNSSNELILVPSKNIYFRLEDVYGEMDLKCKVIAWLSRPSHKGVSYYWQKRVLSILNEFLGTQFTKEDIDIVYTRLGNNVNRTLCIKFITSNYDLSILK